MSASYHCDPLPNTSSLAQEEETLCGRILAVARHHARLFGIPTDDLEDCAMDFLERMLRAKHITAYLTIHQSHREAWLHRCAINHASNYRRSLSRRRSHEVPWPTTCDVDEAFSLTEFIDDSPGPEVRVLTREFWQRADSVVGGLRPDHKRCFVRHYLFLEPVREIAARDQKSQAAVSKTLQRARKRLRVVAERMGITEGDMRTYLVCVPRAAPKGAEVGGHA
jgi:RNA polymerase sigma factor (sigma-70 family)